MSSDSKEDNIISALIALWFPETLILLIPLYTLST